MNITTDTKDSFFHFLDSFLIGVYIFSGEDFIYVNPEFCKITEYSYEECVGKNILKTIAPESAFLLNQYFEKVLSGTLPHFYYKFKCFTKSGTMLYLDSKASRVVYQGQNLVLGYILDVTEKNLLIKELDKLASFPEKNPNPILEIDFQYHLTYYNASVKKNFPEFSEKHPLFIKLCEFLKTKNLNQTENITVEIRHNARIYEAHISILAEMEVIRIYISDITKRKKAEERLFLSNEVFLNTVEGIIITNVKGEIISVNPAFTKITGYLPEEVIGKKPSILKSDRHDNDFYVKMWQQITKTGSWQGEIWNRKKDGSAYLEWLSINAVRNKKNEIVYYIALFTDITNIKKFEQDIDFLSHYDALTGLANRALFQDRLLLALSQAQQEEKKAAVLYIDLDRFKKFNDTFGHIVGDLLLIDIAKRLKTLCPEQTTIARIGGDDFVVIMHSIKNIQDSVKLAQNIFLAMEKPFLIQGNEFFVSLSIGIALFPEDGSNMNQLLKNAELSVRRAKEQGGNQYQLYKPEMNIRAFENLILENKLRKALSQKEFLVYYQPQLDIQKNVLCGAEALIRWREPGMGLVPPDHFIPLAEETGMIVPIGEWILREVCLTLKKWTKTHPHFNVAVNLSGKQFYQKSITETIEKIIKETEIAPSNLTIEITETIMMGSLQDVKSKLQEIKDLGVKIAIDDFGTGYSSLSYLKDFPVDKLKIDKSFLKDVPQDPKNTAIISTIIAIGHNLNMEIIAEGVETEEQLLLLKEKNCEIIQGYYYGRPCETSVFERDFLFSNENKK